jgi:hypothetical protein
LHAQLEWAARDLLHGNREGFALLLSALVSATLEQQQQQQQQKAKDPGAGNTDFAEELRSLASAALDAVVTQHSGAQQRPGAAAAPFPAAPDVALSLGYVQQRIAALGA